MDENSVFKHTQIQNFLMGGEYLLLNPPPGPLTCAVAASQPMDILFFFSFFGPPPSRKAGSATEQWSDGPLFMSAFNEDHGLCSTKHMYFLAPS